MMEPDDSANSRAFDRIAEAYDLLVNEPKRWAYEGDALMRWLAGAGQQRRRVLDVGCGTGFHARHLAGNCDADVTAIDPARQMLEAAQTKPFGDRVRWARASAERPPNGPYDLILVLGNTLSLIAWPGDVLRALAAVAAPGALLVIQTLDYAALREAGPERVERTGSRMSIEKRLTPFPAGSRIAARLEITVHDPNGERIGRIMDDLRDHPTEELEAEGARHGWIVSERRRSYRDPAQGTDRILVLRRLA